MRSQEPRQAIGCNCSLLGEYFTLTRIYSEMNGKKVYKIFQKERFHRLVECNDRFWLTPTNSAVIFQEIEIKKFFRKIYYDARALKKNLL